MVKISEHGNPSNYYIVKPLKKIKKKGLWISFGTNIRREAQYKDGKLLDAKNRPYKNGGVEQCEDGTVSIKDNYLAVVVGILDKIAKAEQEIGTHVIKTLQESRFKYTIASKPPNKFISSEIGERTNTWMNNACANQIKLEGNKLVIGGAPFNDVGAGGIICWTQQTADKIISNIQDEKITPNEAMVLAHEMFHAYDANFGDLDARVLLAGTLRYDARAVYYVNKLRVSKTFNLGYIRTRYHESYSLVDEKNTPIYFQSPSEELNKRKGYNE